MAPSPPVDGYRFEIFQSEPFVLTRFRTYGWRTGWLFIAAPASVLLVLILSAIYGRLSMPDMDGQICRDAATLFHMGKLKCVKEVTASTDFPLLRDVPSIFVILALTATPYIAFRQWSSLEVLLVSMVRSGALEIPTLAERAAIQAEVATANSYLRRLGRSAKVVLGVSGVCVLLVVIAESKLGVYSVFGSPAKSGNDWGGQVYTHWWASWTAAPASSILYWVIGTLGIYFIIIMNLAGSRVLIALWRLRKTLRYKADVYNRDGYHGWAEARGVLLPTYTAILVHGFCLVLVSISLPQPIGLWVLLPILGQWVLTLPFYLGLPPLLTRRGIVAFRGRETARLGLYLRRVEDNRSALETDHRYHTECEAIVQRIRRVSAIHSMPFNRPRDILLAVLQLMATASGVYALIILWY